MQHSFIGSVLPFACSKPAHQQDHAQNSLRIRPVDLCLESKGTKWPSEALSTALDLMQSCNTMQFQLGILSTFDHTSTLISKITTNARRDTKADVDSPQASQKKTSLKEHFDGCGPNAKTTWDTNCRLCWCLAATLLTICHCTRAIGWPRTTIPTCQIRQVTKKTNSCSACWYLVDTIN